MYLLVSAAKGKRIPKEVKKLEGSGAAPAGGLLGADGSLEGGGE